MFIIFIIAQLFEDFFGPFICHMREINSLFFYLLENILNNFIRNLGRLFGLELG